MDDSTNTKKTRKGKQGNPHPVTAWKKGCPPPNPKGRPKEGQSWASIIKEVSEMTPAQVITELQSNQLTVPFTKMPLHVPLKRLVVLRVYSQVMFDPQASLFNSILDRDEGKVTDKVEVTDKTPTKITFMLEDKKNGADSQSPQSTT